MAQISRDSSNKGSDAPKAQVDKIKNLAEESGKAVEETTKKVAVASRDAAETVGSASVRVVQDNSAALSRGVEAAAERSLDQAKPVARKLLRTESDLAGLWMAVTRDQLQHNIDTLQRLTTVRDFNGLIQLQSEFVRQSMSRATQAVLRQFNFAGQVAKTAAAATDRRA